jgi:hypothetical protein
MKTLIILMFCGISIYGPDQAKHCVKKETWGAFSEDDFDRMIKYSVNKEYKLLEAMIVQRRLINIKKGTRVILEDVGWTGKTVIRVPNTEVKIWVVTEAVGSC